jgi:hypothetical protein
MSDHHSRKVSIRAASANWVGCLNPNPELLARLQAKQFVRTRFGKGQLKRPMKAKAVSTLLYPRKSRQDEARPYEVRPAALQFSNLLIVNRDL